MSKKIAKKLIKTLKIYVMVEKLLQKSHVTPLNRMGRCLIFNRIINKSIRRRI